MAKKRPSLKNYLATGDVFAGETPPVLSTDGQGTVSEAPAEENGKAAETAQSTPAASASAKGTAKKKTAPSGKKTPAASEKKAPSAKKSPAVKKSPSVKKKPSSGSMPEHLPGGPGEASREKSGDMASGDAAALLDMLTPEDRNLWEKLFAAAETEYLSLDLVERREDFRTMVRDRFTLFRLEEPGKPLLHVRTSVQIREPLVCLIKWDETGKISVFR